MTAQLGGEVDRSRPAEQPMTRLPRQAITLGPTPAHSRSRPLERLRWPHGQSGATHPPPAAAARAGQGPAEQVCDVLTARARRPAGIRCHAGGVTPVRAVLLDFYCTLVDLSDPVRSRGFDDIARRLGLPLGPGELYRRYVEMISSEPAKDAAPGFVPYRMSWLAAGRRLLAPSGANQRPDSSPTHTRTCARGR